MGNQTRVATTYKVRWWFMNSYIQENGWIFNLNSKHFGQTPSNPLSPILIFASANTGLLKHSYFEKYSTLKCLIDIPPAY